MFLEYYLKAKTCDTRGRGKALPDLKNLFKEYIQYILEITAYDMDEAAKILSLPVPSLHQKLHRYKIPFRTKIDQVQKTRFFLCYPETRLYTQKIKKYLH